MKSKRRAELARVRAEIGPEELARRQARNGKLRAAHGVPGDGGSGDECQVCGRLFDNWEVTATGYYAGRAVDAGECCVGRLTGVAAVGIYVTAEPVARTRVERAVRFIGLFKDRIDPSPFPQIQGGA